MIVLFTGGGSAGHIVPNVPIIERLAAAGHQIHYAGSGAAMEHALLDGLPLTYHSLPTGKFRRYLSWQNIRDAFRVLEGLFAGFRLVGRIKPDVVFSKGGFVSVPSVLGAALRGVAVIAHESDRSPGLANRIAHRVAHTVCTTFPDTRFTGRARLVNTGLPVRKSLREGDAGRGLAWLNFPAGDARKTLAIIGGSLGSRRLNQFVRKNIAELSRGYRVVHLCGRGNLDDSLQHHGGYRQFEFLDAPMGDVLAAADVVISRAGATSLYELLTLRKLALLVPLPLSASRGDQIENAQWAAARGLCRVLDEADLTLTAVQCELAALAADADGVRERAAAVFAGGDATERIADIILDVGNKRR